MLKIKATKTKKQLQKRQTIRAMVLGLIEAYPFSSAWELAKIQVGVTGQNPIMRSIDRVAVQKRCEQFCSAAYGLVKQGKLMISSRKGPGGGKTYCLPLSNIINLD